MNIHEYQGKELLKAYGVAVLDGYVAWTPEEAIDAAKKLPGPVYVVKSQIHAGGRGAGKFKDAPEGKGGVRLAKSLDEVKEAAEAMLGHTLITKQTGPAGRLVRRIYVEAGCDIKRELYVSLLIDRALSEVLVMASTEGGMEIEEVATHHPEKILRAPVDPASGISGFHSRKLAFGLGLEGKQVAAFSKFINAMYKAYIDLDCAIVEINPLVITGAGEVIALDAKVSFDDSALYRHPQVEALRDESEEDPKELEANKHSLNYVALDGSIGCMVNGAGLAMATMDIIKLYGSSPAGSSSLSSRKLAFGLGLEGKQIAAFSKFINAMYAAYTDLDCAIVEINPLVITGAGEVIALDAKVSFDDSALYRHPQVEALRDESEEDPKELEANKHSLNYVALDGSIGCMVNGAGLAMATMDIIKLYGSSPANFLDVGGGATKERVTAAFKIILSDPNVEGILVNIFGGIMRCDVIAEGVIAAAREVKLSVPLVVRLEGTNVQLGKDIMAKSGLPIISADNLADAAEKIVKAVKEAA